MNIFESLSFDRMEVGRLYSIYIYIYIYRSAVAGRDHSVDALPILRTAGITRWMHCSYYELVYIYIYVYSPCWRHRPVDAASKDSL